MSKQKLVLRTMASNGDIVTLDILDPRSTWDNPIIDSNKLGITSNADEIFHRMMDKHSNAAEDGTCKQIFGTCYDEVDDHHSDYETLQIHRDIQDDISKKFVDKSIMSDMTNFYISDEIKEKANEIYTKLEISTKRGGRRKKVVFFCLFQAHRELDIPCDPRVLAKTVGIGANDISRAFSMCSPIETGYYPISKKFHFEDFIPTYYHLTGLSRLNLGDVMELSEEISDKCQSIRDELPQTVAAAILMYYMDINGVSCNFDFSKAVNRSEVTLNQMKKRIENIHNS